MNAIKFIQQHGVEKARELLARLHKLGCPDDMQITVINGMWHRTANGFTYPDLKRLVESVDYVLIHGHEKSKEILKNAPVGAECYSWSIGNSGVRDKTVELVKLKQAIADYESIYGGEHV